MTFKLLAIKKDVIGFTDIECPKKKKHVKILACYHCNSFHGRYRGPDNKEKALCSYNKSLN